MLVLKLELHSAVTGEVTEVGRTLIYNVGGTEDRGDYAVKVGRKARRFSNRKVHEKPLRTGEVKDYPRMTYNVWRLVIRALMDAFPEERGR